MCGRHAADVLLSHAQVLQELAGTAGPPGSRERVALLSQVRVRVRVRVRGGVWRCCRR